ncbi:MAG: DUF4296 domain-containing protein [Pedobacter sp.]|nr:DUF4296 domain-containing protein [Pedobacter sp.]MDQ8051470.1 DUF4296 domain-containing protein [Pedobacter sp.]
MKRIFVFLTCCALLLACKPGIPSSILQPDEMEAVLYDIHVVDGYAAAIIVATPDSLKKTIAPYYHGVYQKHGTDSLQYTRSLNYYYKHPEVMKTIYDHVSERLRKDKDRLAQAMAKESAVPKPATNLDTAKDQPVKNVPSLKPAK